MPSDYAIRTIFPESTRAETEICLDQMAGRALFTRNPGRAGGELDEGSDEFASNDGGQDSAACIATTPANPLQPSFLAVRGVHANGCRLALTRGVD